MYSLPSTSQTRQPLPFARNVGATPLDVLVGSLAERLGRAWNYFSARSNHAFDFSMDLRGAAAACASSKRLL